VVVLDTNVVSYIFNGDPRGRRYASRIRGHRVFISFQTLEELWYGAYSGRWGDRRKNDLARHLEQYEIIWPNPEIVELCARLRSEQKDAARELQEADAWIAATAISLDCPLASHDRDFSGIPDLQLIQAPTL
jgi:predicted nucleic acid-binding protein